MKIRTPWLKGLISKYVHKIATEKFGADVEFTPGDVTISIKDGKVVGHICGDFSLDADALLKTKAQKLMEDK